MSPAVVLARLRAKGIALTADGGNLKYTAPPGVMTDEMKALVVAHKPALLAWLDRPDEGTPPPVVATPVADVYPLSLAQRRLWFLYRMEGPSPTYNIPAAYRIAGPLDVAALAAAFVALVDAHESLRTRFAEAEGRPVQRVIDAPPDYAVVDVGDRSDPSAEARRLADIEAVTPFDLTAAPPLRIRLFRVADDDHVLSVVLNHIVADGWSMTLVTDELRRRYEGFVAGRPVVETVAPLQYRDYCRWQEERYDDAYVERRLAFWRELLRDAPERIDLPVDRPRPSIQSFRGADLPFAIDADLADRLRAIAGKEGASPFMLFYAVYGLLLARLSGQRDLVIAIPAANRSTRETESMIGLFVNTLPLRITLDGVDDFTGLLRSVRGMTLDVFAEQDIPFEALIDALKPERALDHNPYNQAMFLYQDRRLGDFSLPGAVAAPVGIAPRTAKCDLTMTVQNNGDRFVGTLTYATDLFDETTVDRMRERYLSLLRQVAADPARRLDELDLLGDAERRRLAQWGTGDVVPLPAGSLGALFDRQASATPERIALVCDRRPLTYRELSVASDAVAARLIVAGAAPGDVVALVMENGGELIVAMLGVLKAGCAYLPVDPTHPAERVAAMVAAAAVRIALTDGAPFERTGVVSVAMADIGRRAAPLPTVDPTATAYVLFTSGSTGDPKGVAVTHANVVNLIEGLKRAVYADVASTAVVGLIANAVFDASTQQIYAALLTGRTLAVATPAEKRDGASLRRFVHTCGVTVADATPSRLKIMAAAGIFADDTPLRVVLVGGEGFPAALARSIDGVTLYNVYGPTECCVDVTCEKIDAVRLDAPLVPLGRPLPNVRLHIVDGEGRPVPVGTTGELLIAGASVGAGYVGDRERTAERFVAAPFVGEERVYKSGDMARWSADGELHFLGRNDGQIKVRGYRIETGEVESALLSHPAIRDAAAIGVAEEGATALHAFVVGEVRLKEMRAHLAARLPEYMIPAQIFAVATIPVNRSGKIDRTQLLALERRRLSETFVPLKGDAQGALAAVFARTLNVDRVGAHDNYFALGGDSIKALQIVARLREAGWRLELRDIFVAPSVASLAELIRPLVDKGDDGPVAGEGGLLPIEEWFFATYGRQPHFNQTLLLTPARRLDASLLQRVLDAVVARHDGLRARFVGDRRIIPAPGAQAALAIMTVPDAASLAAAAAAAQTRFDLATGPLFTAILFRLADGDRLFLCAHHLLVDGVSWRMILDDIETGYRAVEEGEEFVPPGRTESLIVRADRSARFRRHRGALSLPWWRGVEETPRAAPFAGKEPGRYADRRRLSFALDAERTARMPRAANEAYGAKVDELLLTALAGAWGRLYETAAMVAVVESHGRDLPESDVSRTVGWFTALYPVALVTGGDLPGRIKSVKESMRAVPDGGLSYLPTAERTPTDILFNYLGAFDELGGGLFRRADEEPGPVIAPTATVPFACELVGYVVDGVAAFTLDYDTARVADADALRLMALFEEETIAVVDHVAGVDRRVLTPADIDYDGFGIDDLDHFMESL